MEFPIKLNSSWISTFKNLNADFENVYKRDYLPGQIYNFNAIIQHESFLKNNSNSNIYQVNSDNTKEFVDNLQSWTFRNSNNNNNNNNNNNRDNNGYNYRENSFSSKDENSLKIVSSDNLKIQESSNETGDQDSNDCGSRFETELNRFEIDSENEIEPEISITFENNLKSEILQNYSLETSDSENESLKSEELFIKDTSNLLFQSDVKNLSNDINEPSNDFLDYDLSNIEYSISNKDFLTRNNEIDDQLFDQILMNNENLEKNENWNSECENGNLDRENTLNEIEKVNTIYPNINDFEYLKENINTSNGNKNITCQNNDNHDEIHSIKTEIKTPKFIHHQPKLIDSKINDFSTTNESDQLLHNNYETESDQLLHNNYESVKPINNKVLDEKKEFENPIDEIVETEILQTISSSIVNQKYMANSKELFETNLDDVKNHFENYLTDDNYIIIDDLDEYKQNSIVNDVFQEIHHLNNNIKEDNDDCVTDENKKDVDRDDYNIDNDNKLKGKLHSPDKFSENDINENKYDNKINEKTPYFVIRDNSNLFTEEEITELKTEKDSCSERVFLSQEIDVSNKENETDNTLNTENINDDSFPIYNSPKPLKNSDISVLKNDICKERIISKIDNSETVIYKPVSDEFQRDENSVNKNNFEFSGNLKYENLVNENKKNSSTNQNEFNNEMNESFKTNPTYFKEINGDVSSFVQIPEEKKISFLDDTLQKSDPFNYENSLKINCTDNEPMEIKPNLLDHPKSVNKNEKYEFNNFNCNFDLKPNQNLSGNISKNNWKDYSSSPKKSHVKDLNENQVSFENKNKFNHNYEKKINLKQDNNSFATNKSFQKHESPYKENGTDFTVNNDNQLRSINNLPKYKDVDYNRTDDINSHAFPSFKLPDSSALKSDFDKNARIDHFNVNYSNNFGESDNRKSLNTKINSYKMNDKVNIRKQFCDDSKIMKSNSTIFKFPIDFKSVTILTGHKMRNNSDTYNTLKQNPDSSYNYDSTNLSSKGNFKNCYYPSSQNVLHKSQIKYPSNLSDLRFPYENKRDINQTNESVLVNENFKDKNTPIKNMNTMNSFSVNTKTPSKFQGIYENNQNMIENNEKNNKNASGKPFCKKCMKFHFSTSTFDSQNYNNISKPNMGNKNLKSFNSSNLPKKIITRENNFGKEKFVSNINAEPRFPSKLYSTKYSMTKNDVADLNLSVNSNYSFISDADPTLELRVYCRGRLIYEPLF